MSAGAGAELRRLTLTQASRLIAGGALSPVDLVAAYLDAIETTEPSVHAYTTVVAEQAAAAARVAADELAHRRWRGSLHGIPLGVKDLFDTAGVRTTYGSPRFAEHVPSRDATVVSRLRERGAVLLGKHATHELAWGGRTDSAFYGPTRNPYAVDRIPGGSSGGSAASIVARSALGAVGTDTAGSVRIPAALSGCVGLKPTRGRISLAGAMPLSRSMDHAGVLARTVADAALLFAAVAGPDPDDLRTLDDPVPDLDPLHSSDLGRISVGRLRGWPEDVLDPGVATALDSACDALRAAGVRLEDVFVGHDAEPAGAALTRIGGEAVPLHAAAFAADPTRFGSDLARLLTDGAPEPRTLAEAEHEIARTAAPLWRALTDHDLLLTATVPVPAPLIGAERVTVDGRELAIEPVLTRLTSMLNALGVPALSVPIGLTDGMPVGLQIIGRRLDEPTVLALGMLAEQVCAATPPPAISGGSPI